MIYSAGFPSLLHPSPPTPSPIPGPGYPWSSLLTPCRCWFKHHCRCYPSSQLYVFPEHLSPPLIFCFIAYLSHSLSISLHKNQSPQDEGFVCFVCWWTLGTWNKFWTQKLLNNYYFHEWNGSPPHLPLDILKAKIWFYLCDSSIYLSHTIYSIIIRLMGSPLGKQVNSGIGQRSRKDQFNDLSGFHITFLLRLHYPGSLRWGHIRILDSLLRD